MPRLPLTRGALHEIAAAYLGRSQFLPPPPETMRRIERHPLTLGRLDQLDPETQRFLNAAAYQMYRRMSPKRLREALADLMQRDMELDWEWEMPNYRRGGVTVNDHPQPNLFWGRWRATPAIDSRHMFARRAYLLGRYNEEAAMTPDWPYLDTTIDGVEY